jgi:hypothetical protein
MSYYPRKIKRFHIYKYREGKGDTSSFDFVTLEELPVRGNWTSDLWKVMFIHGEPCNLFYHSRKYGILRYGDVFDMALNYKLILYSHSSNICGYEKLRYVNRKIRESERYQKAIQFAKFVEI